LKNGSAIAAFAEEIWRRIVTLDGMIAHLSSILDNVFRQA